MKLVSQRMLLPLVAPFVIARKAADRLLENEGRDGLGLATRCSHFLALEIQDSKMCHLLSLVKQELSNYAEALSPFGIKAWDTTLADFCGSCDPNQVSVTQSNRIPYAMQ